MSKEDFLRLQSYLTGERELTGVWFDFTSKGGRSYAAEHRGNGEGTMLVLYGHHRDIDDYRGVASCVREHVMRGGWNGEAYPVGDGELHGFLRCPDVIHIVTAQRALEGYEAHFNDVQIGKVEVLVPRTDGRVIPFPRQAASEACPA